ncbi:MAG: YraN family protein [Coriobacteriia bacterium]|nr:YraN family protein [Coriobacteriia bacterium]
MSLSIGKRGEIAARAFYESRNADIVAANWTCTFGEVDLIAKEDDTLVFVEVKTRRSTRAGLPEEQVTRKKQERYIRCAQTFCKKTRVSYQRVRFDVVAIYAQNSRDRAHATLRFIPDAFGEG